MSPGRRPSGAALLGCALLAAVLGVISGFASLMLHEKSWGWLALALAAPASAVAALPAGWLRSAFGLGWVALVFLAVQGRPEGDYVVLSSARGYTLLVFCLVLLVAVVVTLPVRRRVAESGSGPS